MFLDVRVRIAPRARLAFSIIRGSINQAGLTVNDSDTLRNKVVVVTGASRGIGREISISFASQGCRVVLAARSSDQLEIVAKAVQAAGGTAAAITCDVSDRTSARALISGATQAFGSVDILVNNAGSNYICSVALSDDDKWEDVFRTNTFGAYYCTKAALRQMIRAKWGRIINISSVAATGGAAHASAYAAAKAAVNGFTMSVARETARFGITANCVCPWHVDTDLMTQAMQARGRMFGKTAEEYIARIVSESPQRRLITSEEVASTVLFLASQGAGGITGQLINVCGGTSL